MATQNATVQFLTTTKIGEKGQLTVPKEFRHDLKLATGAPFAVLRVGNGLILLPEQQRFERLCQRIRSTLAAAGITPKMLLDTLPEARKRVFAHRYKKKAPAGVRRTRNR